ncbi:hypothetical protein HPB48_005684 [Haemaphysalis longicornis]|uniref:Transposable element P transposase-like RNase H domain-containing protein n=1 Tax=Haemaphysalis longicornis TaxID=44386 RepID=A0A9J6GTG5_HAELO|nr:hypothetical protein HPB48_005684 [Haemaphysalis longicornis]
MTTHKAMLLTCHYTLLGILEELLPALKTKLETMRPEERHCALLVDEMQPTPGLDFDPTVKKPTGMVTVPLANPRAEGDVTYANHSLVVMLTGLASRWKQFLAYHLTGKADYLL